MDRSRGWSLTATHEEKRKKRKKKGQSTRDTSGNWRDQRANVSRKANAPNDSSSAAVEKVLRMRRAGSGMQLLKGAYIQRLEIMLRILAILLAADGGRRKKREEKKKLVLPIVTLEHLELNWHRMAVGKRIKSYEVVSANSQEADP